MARSLKQNKTSRLQELLCDGFVAFTVSLLLLWIPSGSYRDTVHSKFLLFAIGSALFLGAMGYVTLKELYRHRNQPPRTRSLFLCFVLAYLGFTVLSAAASPNEGVFWGNTRAEGLAAISLYALCALALCGFFRPKRWLLPLFGASLLLYSLIGFAQLLGANPLGLFPKDCTFYDSGIRYSGIFLTTSGNVDSSAYVLSVSCGIFLGYTVRKPSWRAWLLLLPLSFAAWLLFASKVEAGLVALLAGLVLLPPVLVRNVGQLGRYLTCLGVIVFAAALSQTVRFAKGGMAWQPVRSAFLFLGAAMLLCAVGLPLALLPRLRERAPRRLGRVLLLAMLGTLALCFAAIWLYDGKTGFVFEAHEVLHGRAKGSYGSGRVSIWRNVLKTIRQRPLLGGGPDTLGQRDIPVFRRYIAATGRWRVSTVDAAHNEYLHIWVNQGLWALLSYLGILGTCVCRWIRGREDDSTAIAGAGALLYCITAFFGISMSYTAIYLWILLSLIARGSAHPICPPASPDHTHTSL